MRAKVSMTSDPPKIVAPSFAVIPVEVQKRPQWVGWQLEPRDSRWAKVPRDPKTRHENAKANDSTTWGTFEEARAWYNANGGSGIGYVFSKDDPFVGVDLDKCRDPNTGDIQPWAKSIIEKLDSYAEVSPSGTGVKLLVCGIPPGPRNRKGNIELYGDGRYFTITGRHLNGTPTTIEERSTELGELYRETFGDDEPAGNSQPIQSNTTAPEDDETLIDKAKNAANGPKFRQLWDGDTTGYDSHSEADLALVSELAFWTGPDPDRIDRLFRKSGLYREKWERADYRTATIQQALTGRTEFRKPRSGNNRPAGQPLDAPNLTDLGNAQRLVRSHGEDLRYCHSWSKWLAWDGTRWAVDHTGEITRRAKDVAHNIYAEAAAGADKEEREAIARHAKRSESKTSIENMITLARSEPGIPVEPGELDQDVWLLNCLNGTLDLQKCKLSPHSRDNLITKMIPVAYDPSARCPKWQKFLRLVMGDDEDLVAFLKRAAGYSLTGDVSERCIFVLFGTGRNGKTTYLEIKRELLGDYALRTPTETLMWKRFGSIPNDVARLRGARFVTATESDEGARFAEATVKDLTGGDTIAARFMRAEWFDFQPICKLWLGTNHKPIIRGTDDAVWDRIRLIPFSVRIPNPAPRREIMAAFREELPGILTWAVEGCSLWLQDGLAEPDQVLEATDRYRGEMDVLAGFVQECCVEAECEKAAASELLAAFREWSGDKRMTQKRLGQSLTERGYLRRRGGSGGRFYWHGIGLTSEPSEPSEP